MLTRQNCPDGAQAILYLWRDTKGKLFHTVSRSSCHFCGSVAWNKLKVASMNWSKVG